MDSLDQGYSAREVETRGCTIVRRRLYRRDMEDIIGRIRGRGIGTLWYGVTVEFPNGIVLRDERTRRVRDVSLFCLAEHAPLQSTA